LNFSFIIKEMSKVEQIEAEIASLTPAEVRQVADWLEHLLANTWDRQLEQDVKGGKLDRFMKEAHENHRQKKTRPFP